MKKIIVLAVSLLISIILVACAENIVEQEQPPIATELSVAQTSKVYDTYENETEVEVNHGGTSIDEVLSNADYFVQSQNDITFVGYVSDVSSQFFYIQNEGESAVMKIDFRGNQVFPQVGDEISIIGQLIQDCCDPSLFMLRAIRFEIVG